MSEVQDETKPTEAQVQEANAQEKAKWEGDFKEEDLVIPYKKEEEPKEPKDDKKTTTSSSKEDGAEKASEEEPEETEEYTDPDPVITVEDPGEYVPKDYSFKVTLANGKKVTVKTPEDANDIADDPDNFETPKQLLDFIRKSQKMENSLEKDKEDYDNRKKTFDEQSETQKARDEYNNFVEKEMDYLVAQGKLPEIPAQYKEANWSDPNVAQVPEVKQHIELLNRLKKEMDKRQKSGLNPYISIIDVQKDIEIENARKEAKRTDDGEARKAASSRVAGVSPSQQGTFVPKGIAVGNPNVFKRNEAIWDD